MRLTIYHHVASFFVGVVCMSIILSIGNDRDTNNRASLLLAEQDRLANVEFNRAVEVARQTKELADMEIRKAYNTIANVESLFRLSPSAMTNVYSWEAPAIIRGDS